MDVTGQVRATIDAHDLIAPGQTLVVAVSGGPDSLCLLDVLRHLRSGLGISLHVAHLNHGLRPEAGAEAERVRTQAAQWDLPCTLGEADVRAIALAEHRSLEEAARVARYRFLAQVARRVGATVVAVAHNADDQVETVLMHCLRGSGLAGLRGMAYCAPWPEAAVEAEPTPRLIRPLLDVPRADIEAYCCANGLQPCRDGSNEEPTFFRNRIRLELLPFLERYSPRLREHLRHTSEVAADDYDYLEQSLAREWPDLVLAEEPGRIALRRASYCALPRSLQRLALRRAVASLRRSLRDVSWTHIESARQAAICGPVGTVITLPANLSLQVGYGQVAISAGPVPATSEYAGPLLAGPERALQVPGLTELAPGGWLVAASVAAEPNAAPMDRNTLCLDADLAGQDLRLRTRQPGDRFEPLGLGGRHQSLKELMIDAKVPRAVRDQLPVLVAPQGILWIVGQRASELARPTPATQRYLCLQLQPPTGQAELEGVER